MRQGPLCPRASGRPWESLLAPFLSAKIRCVGSPEFCLSEHPCPPRPLSPRPLPLPWGLQEPRPWPQPARAPRQGLGSPQSGSDTDSHTVPVAGGRQAAEEAGESGCQNWPCQFHVSSNHGVSKSPGQVWARNLFQLLPRILQVGKA